MRNGGYKIVDCKGTNVTKGSATGVVISGIYDAIEANNKKIVVSGLSVGNTELDDFDILFQVSGDDFVGYVNNLKITVDDDDKIYVSDNDINKELPTYPTEAGTYKLQLVVSSSGNTLSWVTA